MKPTKSALPPALVLALLLFGCVSRSGDSHDTSDTGQDQVWDIVEEEEEVGPTETFTAELALPIAFEFALSTHRNGRAKAENCEHYNYDLVGCFCTHGGTSIFYTYTHDEVTDLCCYYARRRRPLQPKPCEMITDFGWVVSLHDIETHLCHSDEIGRTQPAIGLDEGDTFSFDGNMTASGEQFINEISCSWELTCQIVGFFLNYDEPGSLARNNAECFEIEVEGHFCGISLEQDRITACIGNEVMAQGGSSETYCSSLD